MRVKRQRPRRPQVHTRTGFTLAETLVVLVLLGIVGASLMSVLSKQQAFYQGSSDIIELRTQLRQAQAVIGNDLRGISSPGGDIATMTDSSIDFDYTIGVAVACAAPAGSSSITIPASGALTNGNTLTSWLTTPGNGDYAYIFDEGASSTTATDDSWQKIPVTAVAVGGSCDAGFNSPWAFTVTLGSSASPTTLDGAAIRFVRRVHYSLYRSPNDTLWYLGYCNTACSVSNPINPIAGPFQPYVASTSPDTSGIRITYYDSTGTATSTASQVSRINITLRGETQSYIHMQGRAKGVFHDSLSMSIALRNRS